MTTLKFLVEGGKATPGPPLGPALGPLGVNIGKVVAEINKATAKYAGMIVPVILHIDDVTKEIRVEVGTPPTSALILKELGKEKGSGAAGKESIGSLKLEQVIKIAKIKMEGMNTANLKSAVKQVLGTCVSMGVLVEGKDPREIIRAIDAGEISIE